ncbi:alpha-glucan family phosphorylase [Egicoccus halophilus]|uniref:glycogen phosphorylase n=1 Tax=Egicoccus halophilus TaxID=1670830 RepID=A0A8J3A8F3_9ACTN|nr:alpha-glucan family phosphorylase [Egicoccus halophilus]GGI04579.1 alpha-glucan phosphorylase [Egicoccus halophilus]
MLRSRLATDLGRLALNLRFAWYGPTRAVFEELDPVAWERTGHDPVRLLEQCGDQLDAAARRPGYAARVQDAAEELATYLDADDTWYARSGGDASRVVAYYSAEFALADCLHTYSGGLGVLAGDHLRSASDLGIPLVGIGLAYRDGYFLQRLDASGWQHAEPARNDFHRAPVSPVVGADGQRLTVEVPIGDGRVVAQAWHVAVGRISLYLLDTDVEANLPHHRDITGQLYGGDDDLRLRQELVLGVGGARLLEALGVEVAVHHLNEGHAAFAGLERLRTHLRAGADLPAAIEQVRRELVFTTHTPVPAGHDEFGWDLAAYHLGPLAGELQVDFPALWQLATAPGEERWSQTVLALALAGRANGVARLHGEVSRRMWARLWPDRAVDDVPIGHVTNGVHPGLWVGPELAALFDARLGDDWRAGEGPAVWQDVAKIEPAMLWGTHVRARRRLVGEARDRLATQRRRLGVGTDGRGLDPDALTIGFARRFATYKRATLLAHDLDRLAAILGDDERPVQVLVAGKAHPRDDAGKHLIQHLVGLSRDPRLKGRLVFLEGYDLDLARSLVAGVDVWLNNPLRPLEASGTSGMKAAMNGVLNLSILDGWWDEAVADLAPHAEVGFGWAIGDREEGGDEHARAAADADALYRLLAEQLVPTFYDRDHDGVPHRWVTMMRDAIGLLAPTFSTHRMVGDYVTGAYRLVPARSEAV